MALQRVIVYIRADLEPEIAADPMLGMFDFTKASNPKPTIPNAPVDPVGAAACLALHP